jgi:serine/threonine-protein kinase OSR1/STK39
MTEQSNWLHASFYDQQARIGNGAFSNVYRARIRSKENSFVAIKVMDLEHISSSFEDILQEVQTMKMCDDPNILRCYCSFVNADQLWLVTEMMDKGSCLRVMNVARGLGMGDGMSEEWLAYILREALQGLHYLHNNGQIHRDIKPGNILVDSHGSVRLAGKMSCCLWGLLSIESDDVCVFILSWICQTSVSLVGLLTRDSGRIQ